MKKIRKKKQLEIAIDSIERHPNPKVELEQYSTPSTIASDLLWNAYTLGDIENKDIVDYFFALNLVDYYICYYNSLDLTENLY